MTHNIWTCSNSGGTLVSSYVARDVSCGVRCVNGVWLPSGSAAGIVYIHVFDAASLPANGSVPITQISICYEAKASPFNFELDLHEVGLHFENGLVIASSTTCPTLTLDGARMFVSAMTRV
jgi:hypothetical protein